jgi:hypothetical protein
MSDDPFPKQTFHPSSRSAGVSAYFTRIKSW